MSDKNIELAKTLFPGPLDVTTLFETEEALAAARALYEPLMQPGFVTVNDPQAAFLVPGEQARDGTSEGIEGFIALWRDFLSAWDSWILTPTDFVDVDDERVLVLMTSDGRSKTHGVEMTLDGGNVLTIRDGKVARIEMFFRREGAIEAAGLSE
jgi:hypothetical protein